MQKTQVKAGLGNLINRYREMSDLCCFVSDLPQRCGRFGGFEWKRKLSTVPAPPRADLLLVFAPSHPIPTFDDLR
jgi:hypothetical protein